MTANTYKNFLLREIAEYVTQSEFSLLNDISSVFNERYLMYSGGRDGFPT